MSKLNAAHRLHCQLTAVVGWGKSKTRKNNSSVMAGVIKQRNIKKKYSMGLACQIWSCKNLVENPNGSAITLKAKITKAAINQWWKVGMNAEAKIRFRIIEIIGTLVKSCLICASSGVGAAPASDRLRVKLGNYLIVGDECFLVFGSRKLRM